MRTHSILLEASDSEDHGKNYGLEYGLAWNVGVYSEEI